MKSKQLPDDLCDWLKARTFVIGAVTSLEPISKGPGRRATHKRTIPDRQPSHKVRWHPQTFKLAPLLESEARGLLCLTMPKNH